MVIWEAQQDESNPAMSLALRAGKMALSCPLGITAMSWRRIVFFDIINLLLTKLVQSRLLDIGFISFALRSYTSQSPNTQ